MYVFIFPIYIVGIVVIFYIYSKKIKILDEKDCRDICCLSKCNYPDDCPIDAVLTK